MRNENDRNRIDVRCSNKEKDLLKELSKDRGMTVSEYIREKLFGRKVTVRYTESAKGNKQFEEV